MWMKIGSNDITPKITRGSATRDFFRCPTRENNFLLTAQ
jgi:hypothetical protein